MFFAVALAALPLFAQSVSAGACTRQYTINAGDICDRISAAKNVSTYQLATVNHGIIDSACSNLQIGATICLGYEGEDCSTTYVVKPDDTCSQIAAAHGINSTILYGNNPQINDGCTNIYVGEVLCVAGTVQCPPPPAANTKSVPPPAPKSPEPKPAPAPPVPAPAPANQFDDDDEDLPYCDEL
ncbi:hypothetical protein ONZ45_g18509 [Pleurotus djamor]|nr:hypothetical protein ONZ45_g18509 [Pleurotus djamor]